MLKKISYTLLGMALMVAGTVFAAPYFIYQPTILPQNNSDLGTSSAKWRNVYISGSDGCLQLTSGLINSTGSACGGGTGSNDGYGFITDTYGGLTVQSTTTGLWLKDLTPYSLIASSTLFTWASTSQLSVTGTATSTFAGDIKLTSGTGTVTTDSVSADGSDGLKLENGARGLVALLGAGNGLSATFYDGVNVTGALSVLGSSLLTFPYSSSTIYSSFLNSSTTNAYFGTGQGFSYIGSSGKLNSIASSSIQLSWFNNDAGFLTSYTSPFEIATTSDIAVPNVAYFTRTAGRTTLGSVATGTIAVPTGLTATANRYVLGGNLTLGLDTGYVIPLQSTLDAKALGATTITINGTANQISSSAGAQDLSANRTWTLSFPNQVIFPGYASSTSGFSTPYASSTALHVGTGQGFLYTGSGQKVNAIASSSVNLSWFNNDAGFLTSYDAWSHPSAGVSATTSSIVVGTTTRYANSVLTLGTPDGAGEYLTITGDEARADYGIIIRDGKNLINSTEWTPDGILINDKINGEVGIEMSSSDAGNTRGGQITVYDEAPLERFVVNGIGLTIKNAAASILSFFDFNAQKFGFGTSTPTNLVTLSTSTAPQLTLSDGAGIAQWAFRNAGGNLYLSTTTVQGIATTSSSALEISGSGFGTTTLRGLNIIGFATSTSNVGFNITNGCYAINGTCLSTGGTSAYEIATTSTIAVPQLAYFTNASGRTTLGGVATTSVSCTGTVSCTGFNVLGSAPITITGSGLTSYNAWVHPFVGYSATTSAVAVGTTTSLISSFTSASSTAPQLSLSAGAGIAQWVFRNAGGALYIATTTAQGTATTTSAAIEISNTGFGTTTIRNLNISSVATTTANIGFNLTAGCYAISGTCLSAFSNTLAAGGTGSTSFSPNTIVTVNAAGTALISTTSQLSVGNLLATTSTATSTFRGMVEIGSSTMALARSFLTITGTENNYIQTHIQNRSTGNNASAVYVAGDNRATDSTYFVEFGINNSTYAQASFASQNGGDGFLLASDGALVVGVASSTNTLADLRFITGGTASTSIRSMIDYRGYGMYGTTTNTRLASMIFGSSTAPQIGLSANTAGTNHWTFRNAGGNFYLSTSTAQGQATSSSPAFSLAGSNGIAGFGTTTPFASLSISTIAGTWPFVVGSSTATFLGVNQAGGILTTAVQPSTTTAITLDWSNTPPQVEYRIGTSATTITLINATTSTYWGTTKRVIVCNPGTTAGAVTWAGVRWIGTAPTQTTTANQCDLYSFFVTRATSSSAFIVAGGANTGLQ